jgi:hypothetical protein
MTKPDIEVTGSGSIFLLDWLTQAGKEWMQENLPSDVILFGDSVVVEHRYISDIVKGMTNDGLLVK